MLRVGLGQGWQLSHITSDGIQDVDVGVSSEARDITNTMPHLGGLTD
ncbi:hypothetical protein [Staphylococcus haemolyticus]|nr:hypothetical protein [Staphylococcus haemolyticus]